MDRTILALALIAPLTAPAQELHLHPRPLLPHHVVPQARRLPEPGSGRVQVTGVNVTVAITDQMATTTMDVALRNPTPARLESELVVPVPARTVVRGFQYQGAALEGKLEVLPADEARRIYDATVVRQRDPALLEFIGNDLVRSSVFPVEAGAEQKVRLIYEHLLPLEGSRVDYVIPRTESLEYQVPWTITVRIRSRRPLSTVYSPSHPFRTVRAAPGELSLQLEPSGATAPGPVRLSFVLGGEDMGAAFFAYPEAGGEAGYFLVVAGAPGRRAAIETAPRELTLVVDRSGSMQGTKWSQTVAAAREVLHSLRPEERFNVVLYHQEVEAFARAPIPASPASTARAIEWIGDHGPRGGTNIHEALQVALAQPATAGTLPLVLFLTDGLPTVGETREASIVQLAARSNPAGRRIFTFGIGADVNSPLLERIAWESRAVATFLLPGDDVRERMVSSFRRLGSPVLASPTLRLEGAVEDVFPARLPDLFEGDQLVLVGRYRGRGPRAFEVSGREAGLARSFRFTFDVASASTRHGFVPRLWASRKIGELLDRIRNAGSEPDPDAQRHVDPLTAEVVRLSREFGILTEYTAFLAREGVELGAPGAVMAQARKQVQEKALTTRSGAGSVAQDANRVSRKSSTWVDPRNSALDEELRPVEFRTVNQVGDLAFYKRGRRWVDARLLRSAQTPAPTIVAPGSAAHRRLAERLARDGRQGALALSGEVLLLVDGEPVSFVNP